MNKREKLMLGCIACIVLLFVHLWAFNQYQGLIHNKKAAVTALETKLTTYRSSSTIAQMIADEVVWIKKHEPAPSTFGDEQSRLLAFLNSSAAKFGITPVKPQLSPLKDDGGKYQRTKIQIQATATEEQIYKWLVAIHQPTEFRAVTQILMRPSSKVEDDGSIICILTAEQWLIDSE